MKRPSPKLNVYLETGQKRTFAGAIDWPGWCRSGKDAESALQALFEYGPRYSRAIQSAQLDFQPPADSSAMVVAERLAGDATTEFGAPGIAPAGDALPVDDAELGRLQALLQACWQAFDAAALAAAGKELRKGPRGGGRDLEEIIRHTLDGEAGYLSRLAWKLKLGDEVNLEQKQALIRQAVLDALDASAHGRLPERGPRGGRLWTVRYYARRSAWHVLDHAWEIEDRLSA